MREKVSEHDETGADEIPRYPRRGKNPFEATERAMLRPLKVAILHGLIFRFRTPLFRRLSAHPSLEVRIIAGTGTPGTKYSNAPDLSGIDARILWTLKKDVKSSGRNRLLTFNPSLMSHLIRFRPDVLLVEGGAVPNNLVTLLYAKLTGTPIVWWSLGQVVGREFKGLSDVYRNITRWIERRATCYAGFSSASVHYFRQEGYDPLLCYNLVNVVDTELVEKKAAECRDRVAALARKLNLEEKTVLLFVGTLAENKGVETLIKAYADTRNIRRDLHLLIVGDGPIRASAEELVKELGLCGDVTFTGAVYEGVEAYFQLGNLLLLPGAGGLAISEGMVHGLPVICSVGDGVEVDLIDEGKNGYRVQPGNAPELASKMLLALQEPRRLTEMGHHSRRIIEERANIDLYMNEMLAAIFFAYEHSGGPTLLDRLAAKLRCIPGAGHAIK